MTIRRPKVPFNHRLAVLGIDQEEFRLYFKLFVVRPGSFYQKSNSWFRIQRPPKLSKYYIAKHLQHECILGRAMPLLTNYFCFDLDTKHCVEPPEQRSRAIQAVFGEAVAIRSSTSGGVHLYYFLRKPLNRNYLAKLLSVILEKNGIQSERGCIETFPGLIHQLRLPFGTGSCLLDSGTLQSKGMNLKESLHYVRRFVKRHRMAPSRILHEFMSREREKTQNFEGVKSHLHARLLKSSQALREPLHTSIKYGERHQALMAPIPPYVQSGLSDEEIIMILTTWLDKPGQQSKDWERDKHFVVRDIESLLKNYRNKTRKGFKTEIYLGMQEGDWIMEKTSSLKQSGRFGHDAYYLQQFLFGLMCVFRRNSSGEAIPLSQRFLLSLDGTSRKRLSRQMAFLREAGILGLAGRRNRARHLCRTYKLYYSFAEREERGFACFQEYLLRKFSEERLRTLYTRHLCACIQGPSNRGALAMTDAGVDL